LLSNADNLKGAAEMDWPMRLQYVLDASEPLGTLATVSEIKSVTFPLPMVTVERVGKLGFPLMDMAVEPLKSVSEKAPFGEGTDTPQAENAHKDWRIDASQVTLGGGDAWDDLLKSIVNAACRGLGFSDDRINDLGIHACFKELLLREAGGQFTTHTDKDKEMGTFGTLVIQLPSQFTGGELAAWHGGQTMRFELAALSAEQYKLIAFYADCEHLLHPLTSGIHVCLVFNLVSIPAIPTIKFPAWHFLNDAVSGSKGVIEGNPVSFPIAVEGIGRLGFPIVDVEAIKAISTMVPSKDDEGSTGVWEIDARQVHLPDCEEWDQCLAGILQKVEVCCPRELAKLRLDIRMDFKGVRLYENSDPFIPKLNEEDESGICGTVILQLPSKFEGGHMVVESSQRRALLLDGLADWEDKLGFVAFNIASRPTFHPVTSGVRVCLEYALLPRKKVWPPTHWINVGTESKLQSVVNDWTTTKDSVSRLGYPLINQYTPESFSFDAIDGRDLIIVQTLLNAKCSEGRPLFKVHLLLMERHVKMVIDGHWGGNDITTDDVVPAIVLDSDGNALQDQDGWTMYLSKDGWMKPAHWMEEHEGDDVDGDDNEEDNNEEDDYGFVIRAPDRMFQVYSPTRAIEERSKHGTTAYLEHWYHAAAVVVSPTAKRNPDK
jgi:hypothetical protein